MAMPDSQGRRGRFAIQLAQLLLVVAAGALWAASRLPWVSISSFDGLGPPKTTTVSGASWSSALLPVALLLLVTAIAAIAVRGWPLRVLATLVAVAALSTGYVAISVWVVNDVAVRAAGLAGVLRPTVVGSQRHYTGAAIALTAAVCTLAGTVVLMRSASMSGSGGAAKYKAVGARRSTARRDDDGEAMSQRLIWDALDEGCDLTDDRTDKPTDRRRTEGR
jgi:uncharacterized membrane protein (TIGR02234 family)